MWVHWKKYLLIAIIIFAACLRLSNLVEYPKGLNADEAAIAYNAYSLIQTGRDEHGMAFPLTFTSFGDYKAPLYFYIVLPFVAVLGLSELAVRLPSALFGVASVFLIYLLAKRVFASNKAGLFAAFLLAISPWHIHYSRGGWEVNVATFFITLGVLLFISALTRPRLYYGMVASFAAAMYAYQSPKIIVPLLGMGIVALYGKRLWQQRKLLIGPIILGAVLLLPIALSFTQKTGYARFSGVSIFADTGPFWAINEARGEHDQQSQVTAKVLHNKVIGYGLNYLKNYSDHFTPAFLFFVGDTIDRNNVPEMGQLYAFEALLIVIGIWFLMKSSLEYKWLVFLWLFVAPMAAAITFQTPHALRSQNMVIPLTLLGAYGATVLTAFMRRQKKTYAYTALAIATILVGYSLIKYLHQYYVHIPAQHPFANQEGFKELVAFVEQEKHKYQKVIITDRYDQPYILFLFYSKKDPRSFQSQVKLTPRDNFGFSTVRGYDNYEFRPITEKDLVDLKQTLIVGSDKEIPDTDGRIIKTIEFSNGQKAFEVIEL